MELRYLDARGHQLVWQAGSHFIIEPKRILLAFEAQHFEIAALSDGRIRALGSYPRHDDYRRQVGVPEELVFARFEAAADEEIDLDILGFGGPFASYPYIDLIADSNVTFRLEGPGGTPLAVAVRRPPADDLYWTPLPFVGGLWSKSIRLNPAYDLKPLPVPGPRQRPSGLAERTERGTVVCS